MIRRGAITILLIGLGISVLGDQVYLIALNVSVLARTHSSIAVAGLWIAPQLAGLFLGSFMGSLADRWDRRFSLVSANLISAIFIGVIPLLHNIMAIYGAIFVVATCNALFTASLASYIKILVPPTRWARVSALRGLLSYGSLVLGPALAGLLLIHGKPGTAIWLDAITFLISAATLMILPRLNPDPTELLTTPRRRPGWITDLQTVKNFLNTHRRVLAVIVGFSALMIFGTAADAQEVVFTRAALHLSQSGYGYLVSAAGIGYVIGALISYALGKRLSMRMALGIAATLSASSYLFYARSTSFLEAAIALVLLGIFQSQVSVGYTVYLQESLPTESMGRIIGTVNAGRSGLIVIAILAGGVLARITSVRFMMTGASALAVLGGLGLTVLFFAPWSQARLMSKETTDCESL